MKSKIFKSLLLIVIIFIGCNSSPAPTKSSIVTNDYNRSISIEEQSLIYLPHTIKITKFNGQILYHPWENEAGNQFIAVIEPGYHNFEMDFETISYTPDKTIKWTANDIIISHYFLPGRFYEIKYASYEGQFMGIYFHDNTDNYSEYYWQKKIVAN